jgi:hypothetical protein
VLLLGPGAEHVGNLERFGLRVDNIDRRRTPLSLATGREAVQDGYVLRSGETLGHSQDTKHRCLFWRWPVEWADHAGVRLAEVCLTKEL